MVIVPEEAVVLKVSESTLFDNIDLLIVGAGPVGCVLAERAATQLGWQCLILDRRNHIAGNCYDRFHESGILIHQYGPHMFRTNNAQLIEYLSNFTQWVPSNHMVKSFVDGKLYPFPINLDTLEQFFNRSFTAETAQAFLEDTREKIAAPANSEEFVLSRVGKAMYEAFYLNYTVKQWGIHPRDLAASVCGRIPIRLNRDPRFVDHRFQMMPANGFTAMFNNMVKHPNIHLLLQTDYEEVRHRIHPTKATIYSGPIDEYFGKTLGALPWRSLSFDFQQYDTEYRQPCSVLNYPNDFGYTRSFESKHITGQKHPNTVVCYEYPQAEGDPYYPVPAVENTRLYQAYEKLAEAETQAKNVIFVGRLARYQYINSDEAIEKALDAFEDLRKLAS
jgi:UDP-galactopyranose mutase